MQDQFLEAMGITRWRLRSPALQETVVEQADLKQSVTEEKRVEVVVEEIPKQPEQVDISCLNLAELKNNIANCEKCGLHKSRAQTVFGEGSQTADWLIIGDAPGTEEDNLGQPFVGEIGQLLTAMLLAMGLKREQVFVTNLTKCHPAQGHKLQADEIATCGQYLRRQIELIKPTIIIAAGKVAAQSILKTESSMSEMREQNFEYENSSIPVVVTYHPAYLLRKPSEKRKAWYDLKAAMNLFAKLSESKK